MKWDEIRNTYPDQWLIIEALETHTTPDYQVHLDRLTVIERCTDGNDALTRYRRLHKEYPQREFYFVHTSRTDLDIRVLHWTGIRRNHAAAIQK